MNLSGVTKRLGILLGFLAVIAIAWHNLSPVFEARNMVGQVGQIESYCFIYGSGCMELQTQNDLGKCCTPLFAEENECNQGYANYLEQPSLAANCCQLSCNGVQSCIDQCSCDLTGDCDDENAMMKSAFSLTLDSSYMPVAMSAGKGENLSMNMSGEIPVEFEGFEEALSLALMQQQSTVRVSGSGSMEFEFAGTGELLGAIQTNPSLVSVSGSGTSSMTLSFENGVGVLFSTTPVSLMVSGAHRYLPVSAMAIVSVGGIDPALLPSAFPLQLLGSGLVTITAVSDGPTSVVLTVSGSLSLVAEDAMMHEESSAMLSDAAMMDQSSLSAAVMSQHASSSSIAPPVVSSSQTVSSAQVISSAAPVISSAPVRLPVVPLQPVQPVTRPPVSSIPLQQTGPAVALVIAIGAAAGSGWMRRKK